LVQHSHRLLSDFRKLGIFFEDSEVFGGDVMTECPKDRKQTGECPKERKQTASGLVLSSMISMIVL
jgi:hypothetical protein